MFQASRNAGLRTVVALIAAAIIAVPAASAIGAESANPLDKLGRHVEVPGARIWVVDTGGSGVPVMLLHPSTGTSASWENQVAVFAKAGYRVVVPERRGWGKSMADAATGPQPGNAADDIDVLADKLKLGRFHLVSVAGGGFIALDYAAWRPERLRSLVVGASTGSFRDPEIQEFIKRIEIPELRKQSPMYREVGSSYRGANPKGLERWLDIDHHARQPGAPSQGFRSPNTFKKMEALTMPVLVIAGGSDLIAPPGMMKIWASRIKGAQFTIIPDAGHSIAWERPDLFNEMVLDFLAKAAK
jgi:pimeloyl-ACP methyl ester carboxylesterase